MFFSSPVNPALHEQVSPRYLDKQQWQHFEVWKLIVHSSKRRDASKVSTSETHMHAVKKNFWKRFYKFVLLLRI